MGRDIIERSLRCVRWRGLCVLYGVSSGPVSSISPFELAEAGSIFFTRQAREEQAAGPICVGILLTFLGLTLIGVEECYSLELSRGWLIYMAGFTVFLSGLFLIWKDLLSAPTFQEELAAEPEGVYLGRFDLNGYSLKAYEREADNGGRQFRLISFPAATHEREAAFIRYIC